MLGGTSIDAKEPGGGDERELGVASRAWSLLQPLQLQERPTRTIQS